MRFKGEYQQAEGEPNYTKCPFCNSDALIQTGVVSYNIKGDVNSIRMKCINVHCQAIIETEYDPELYSLAYMGLLQKIKELRENPIEERAEIKNI